MHGGHWFDKSNPDDIELLNKWKNRNTDQDKYAIKIWTQSDLLKKKTAEEQHLHYLVFWSEDEFNTWINSL